MQNPTMGEHRGLTEVPKCWDSVGPVTHDNHMQYGFQEEASPWGEIAEGGIQIKLSKTGTIEVQERKEAR